MDVLFTGSPRSRVVIGGFTMLAALWLTIGMVVASETAIALTVTGVDMSSVTEVGSVETSGEADEPEGVPLWIVQGLLGIVGIVVFFGIITFMVSRFVAIAKRRE